MPKPWGSSFNEGYTKNMTPIDNVSTSQKLTPKETINPFHQEDKILNIKTFFPKFLQPQPSKPRPRDYSYEEWLGMKLGHTNVNSRRFDEYKRAFDNEIKQLANGNDLRIGRKGYAWMMYGKNAKNSMVVHYNHGTMRDSMRLVAKTDCEPPFMDIETFEIKRYSFKGGRSFVCITKQLDDALLLGRANGSRFMGMIKKEMEEEGGVRGET
ncbi:hypothetical protein Tco_0790308 [Tanacetum coccineum]